MIDDQLTPEGGTRFVHTADDYSFESEVIHRSMTVPVLVDCWAEWCGPCQALGPTLERLAEQYQGRFELVKVDIDQAQHVARALRVQSVPFMILFVEGRPVDALVGNQSESDLKAFLDRHIPAADDDPYELGIAALKAGQYEDAVHELQRAMSNEPERADARLALARATLALGDLDAASQLLESIPSSDPLAERAKRLRALFSLAEFQGDEQMLNGRISADQQDVDAWYRLGVTAAFSGQFQRSCEAFLHVVRLDRGYREDAGRQGLLLIFEVLGGEGEVVSQARRELASLLF